MSDVETMNQWIKVLNRDKICLLSRELRTHRLIKITAAIDSFIDELQFMAWEIEDAQKGKGGDHGSN